MGSREWGVDLLLESIAGYQYAQITNNDPTPHSLCWEYNL